MGAIIGQWLMHERWYFRLMVAAKHKIRPHEKKDLETKKQNKVEQSGGNGSKSD